MLRYIKITICVVAMFFQKFSYCQRYFNELVDYNNQNGEGLSSVIQLKDSTYLAVGFTYFSSTGFNFYSSQFNKFGQKTHETVISYPLIESQGMSVKKITDTTLIVCGIINDVTSTGVRTNRDVYLLKIKNNGDTLWTKRFGLGIGSSSSPDYEIANDIIVTHDKNFVMVGTTSNAGNGVQVYLIKTDSDGNIIWQQTYGGGNTDVAYMLAETPDKGFIMTGYTYSFGAGDRDGYVVKTDSLGSMQWQQTYGGGGNDGTGAVCNAKEGGYTLGGWYSFNPSKPSYLKPRIIKIDNSGNVVWSKLYGNSKTRGDIEKIIQLDDSSYVGIGNFKDTLGLPNAGLIMKVKANGDSVWGREYKRTPAQDDYFYGFSFTNDKGFIIAGQVHPYGTPSNTQDGWLIKVDCLGADSITQYLGNSCYAGNPSGINELSYDYSSAALANNYPNPFTYQTTIAYYLPDNSKQSELVISDVTGNVIIRYQLKNGEHNLELSNLSLAQGVYYYSLYSDKKCLSTKKMLVLKD